MTFLTSVAAGPQLLYAFVKRPCRTDSQKEHPSFSLPIGYH